MWRAGKSTVENNLQINVYLRDRHFGVSRYGSLYKEVGFRLAKKKGEKISGNNEGNFKKRAVGDI